MNQNNTNMSTFNFNRISVNPSDLKAHPLLEDLGYSNKSDAHFAEMMKYFGHYESPVIDRDNNVITHWADVQAAVENCKKVLECYSVDMTVNQLRRFILLKHKYNVKNLISGFKTVQFYEDYLTNDEEGIELSSSLDGTTREKIAFLMHTSDSTIKRLKEVGENKPEKLGLIEQGYTSFKQVQGEIKAERLAAAIAARQAEQLIEPTVATPNDCRIEPAGDKDDIVDILVELPEPVYYEEVKLTDKDYPQEIELIKQNQGEQYYEESVSIEEAPKTQIDFTEGTFTIAGLGKLEISVTNNAPSVIINGKSVANMSYLPVVDERRSDGTAHSFVLQQKGKNAFCIQLTIENISKAA